MDLVKIDDESVALIKKQLCPNATEGELALFIQQCKRTGLDPFSRQIYMIERKHNDNGVWKSKFEIQISIDGLRVIAQRSDKYAGQVGPFWCGKDGIWHDVWLDNIPPSAAKVGVVRSDFREPLWAVARWDSYCQTKKDGTPSNMWKKMPDLMLAKTAESLALRKAFPNDMSGLYTSEEMGQAENEQVLVQQAEKKEEIAYVREAVPDPVPPDFFLCPTGTGVGKKFTEDRYGKGKKVRASDVDVKDLMSYCDYLSRQDPTRMSDETIKDIKEFMDLVKNWIGEKNANAV